MPRSLRNRLAVALTFATIATTAGATSGIVPPDGVLAAGVPTTAAVPVPAASTAGDGRPVSTIGVLETDEARCTATVVASGSGSVIATAAHCVYLNGRWNLGDARFYPGYHDGEAPFGVWDVESAWVPEAWQHDQGRGGVRLGSPLHDVAFARLRPDARGRTAAAVLGSEGIRFDTGAGTAITELGYPSTGRYDGTTIRACEAVTRAVSFPDGTAMVADCDFTPGASGGPWLSGGPAGSGSGHVTGVLSGIDDDGRNYSAAFGSEAEQLYAAADRGST